MEPVHLYTFAFPHKYEIRQLVPEDAEAVRAIIAHSDVVDSPLVQPATLAAGSPAALAYSIFDALRGPVQHWIESGLSFGVFDKEYWPRHGRPGNTVYWQKRADVPPHILLKQVDSPLVAVALSSDSYERMQPAEFRDLLDLQSEHGVVNRALDLSDTAPAAIRSPRKKGELVMCHTVHTRLNHAGRGIATGLCQFLVSEMSKRGFRAIQVTTAHPGMTTKI